MPTLEEIAKAALVSRSTVSRVINNEPRVSESTRKHVWEVIKANDYHPNTAARALAGRRSYIIGLIHQLPYETLASDPFFAALSGTIASECEENGYFLMMSITTASRPDSYAKVMKGGHLDGIVLFCSTTDEALVNRLTAEKFPFVVIGRPYHEMALHSVDVDNWQASRLVAHHLANLGYLRMATISGPQYALSSIDRQDGFIAGLSEQGLECPANYIVEGDFSEISAYHGMKQLLRLDPRPQAVFAANDAMALGAMRAIRAEGLRVPDDIAIVGYDDMPFAAVCEPPLTTVRQSPQIMGKLAVQLLLEQLESDTTRMRISENVVIQAELIVRESCGAKRRAKVADSGHNQADQVKEYEHSVVR